VIGLALEGGGAKGSYQAGAYMAMKKCGIRIDAVAGTSIGSLNGALIAAHEEEKMLRLWRDATMMELLGIDDTKARDILKRGLSFHKIKATFTEIYKAFKSHGLDMSNYRALVRNAVDEEKVRKSDIKFGLTTVRVENLEPMERFIDDIPTGQLHDYITASSYLPVFKKEKLIDDGYYLDGGFYDLGPVNMLLNKGYDTIYLVKVHGIGISRKYDKNANVIVIESKRKLGGVMDLDPNRIDENIKMGYYDTIRILKHLDGEKYVFKVKSEKYYKYLNRKVNYRFYRRVKNFFKTTTYKETTIKALEYIMEHESINYYKIYNPYKIIKYINKKYDNDLFIYKYVKKLKHFI